jgi:hypothetical protein
MLTSEVRGPVLVMCLNTGVDSIPSYVIGGARTSISAGFWIRLNTILKWRLFVLGVINVEKRRIVLMEQW